MSRHHFVTKVLATTMLVLPSLPTMADEPGFFKVPGTETSLKIYGSMILDTTYETVNATGPLGGLGTGIWYKGFLIPDSEAPKNQLDLTAARSRFGITSTTPSDLGEIKVQFEGDFSPDPVDTSGHAYFHIRHAYGQIGGLLAGQYWTTFMDVEGRPEVLDWDGLIADYYAGTRVPQVRYTFRSSAQSSLAVALERSIVGIVGASSDTKKALAAPASLVAAYKYGDGWGHVMGAIAFQKYSERLFNDPTGAHPSLSTTTVSWSLSSSLAFGKDTLAAHVGMGDGFYGPWLQDGVYERDNGTTPVSLFVVKALQWDLGYTHVWTPKLRSNLFVSDVTYSRDAAKGMTGAAFKSFDQIGANTIVKLARNSQVGLEYLWGKASTFDSNATLVAAYPHDNKVSESKVRLQFKYGFF